VLEQGRVILGRAGEVLAGHEREAHTFSWLRGLARGVQQR
jgi:hypothetical protein